MCAWLLLIAHSSITGIRILLNLLKSLVEMCFIDVYMFSVTLNTQLMSRFDIRPWFNFVMGRLTDNVNYLRAYTFYVCIKI